MCNHFEEDELALEWALTAVPGVRPPAVRQEVPRHIWPKYQAPVIVDVEGQRECRYLRWGVWPFYARAKAQYITNARDDGLLGKPTWKQSVAKRRCLIPATGYYEPGQGPPGARGELRFTLVGRRHFFFAGLWDRDPDDSGNHGFAMVTTRPNEYAARFHDRMPVVLGDADALTWLGSTALPDDKVLSLCVPMPDSIMAHEAIAPFPKEKKITREQLKSADGELLL